MYVSQSEITRFPPGETKTIIAARHGTAHEREGGRRDTAAARTYLLEKT